MINNLLFAFRLFAARPTFKSYSTFSTAINLNTTDILRNLLIWFVNCQSYTFSSPQNSSRRSLFTLEHGVEYNEDTGK